MAVVAGVPVVALGMSALMWEGVGCHRAGGIQTGEGGLLRGGAWLSAVWGCHARLTRCWGKGAFLAAGIREGGSTGQEAFNQVRGSLLKLCWRQVSQLGSPSEV
jgi:hypothetical protein